MAPCLTQAMATMVFIFMVVEGDLSKGELKLFYKEDDSGLVWCVTKYCRGQDRTKG